MKLQVFILGGRRIDKRKKGWWRSKEREKREGLRKGAERDREMEQEQREDRDREKRERDISELR